MDYTWLLEIVRKVAKEYIEIPNVKQPNVDKLIDALVDVGQDLLNKER